MLKCVSGEKFIPASLFGGRQGSVNDRGSAKSPQIFGTCGFCPSRSLSLGASNSERGKTCVSGAYLNTLLLLVNLTLNLKLKTEYK